MHCRARTSATLRQIDAKKSNRAEKTRTSTHDKIDIIRFNVLNQGVVASEVAYALMEITFILKNGV